MSIRGPQVTRTEPVGELEGKLGKAIASHRRRAELSQEALAERAGVHTTYISQLERGLKSPTVRVLHEIARAMRTEAHVLLREMVSEDPSLST